MRVPALTDKDRKDLRFALAHGADYIAVSFVRRPEDVLLAKSLIRRAKKDTPEIAKLEKPEAIENLEAILRASEGVIFRRLGLLEHVSQDAIGTDDLLCRGPPVLPPWSRR